MLPESISWGILSSPILKHRGEEAPVFNRLQDKNREVRRYLFPFETSAGFNIPALRLTGLTLPSTAVIGGGNECA